MNGNEPATPRRSRALYWSASIAIAAALLYFSLRGIEWGRVWTVLKSARPGIVALALGVISFNLLLRSLRWRVLLAADRVVPIPLTFWATCSGYLGNSVLPARAGEVVRTLIISSRSGISRAYVLTTAFSERIIDAVVLLLVSVAVLFALPQRPGWIGPAARPIAILGLAGVAAIALLPAFESFWVRLLGRIPVGAGIRVHLEDALRHVLQGVRSFHDRGRLLRFFLFTTVIWLLDGLIAATIARAVGLTFSIPLTFLLVAGLGLGSALPSTPGYVGIYQFVAVSILTPFGFSRSDSIAYIICFQGIMYVAILVWGLLGLQKQRSA